ncbi:MAG: tRNA 2-thiouridine(34) synthase MnmA [Oscillospiraceae bacterium]|jgi:tRNA-specific 2-thiouridylase|nr:tRNA 2-thiouridine(34) synthase MnmA [Oscillospiraceae bacterium]
MPQALIAMSGGVDSSAAAYLMQQAGYDCLGAMMKLWDGAHAPDAENESRYKPTRTCCSLEDAQDARSVATRLGMPFYVFNYTEAFNAQVIEKFCAAYLAGLTPNPCLDCNKYMKFDLLLQRGNLLGCSALATGHYARVERGGSRTLLRKAVDAHKDQSYVLYMLTQAQLAQTHFPLGDMTKAAVRDLAKELGFWNAKKPDSQDICFVPDGDYGTMLERRGVHETHKHGDFIDADGNILGQHNGQYRYTIGQRKGLGLAFDAPRYVLAKDPAQNTVTLGRHEELARRDCTLRDINLIATAQLDAPLRVRARTRYHQAEFAATVEQTDADTLRLHFDAPQYAIAPGQAAVLYDGDYVVGGGTIQG